MCLSSILGFLGDLRANRLFDGVESGTFEPGLNHDRLLENVDSRFAVLAQAIDGRVIDVGVGRAGVLP